MSSKRPILGIAMVARNEERHMAHAIRSLLCQTYTDFSLTIINNGSTDSTGEIADSFAAGDSRVIVVHLEKNDPAAGYRVLQESKSPYWMAAAGHDYYAPAFIEKCMAALEADPGVVLAYTRASWLQGDSTGELIPGVFDTRGIDRLSRALLVESALVENYQGYGIYRLAAVKGMRSHSVIGSDHIWLTELALAGTFALIDEPLFFLRKAPDWGNAQVYLNKHFPHETDAVKSLLRTTDAYMSIADRIHDPLERTLFKIALFTTTLLRHKDILNWYHESLYAMFSNPGLQKLQESMDDMVRYIEQDIQTAYGGKGSNDINGTPVSILQELAIQSSDFTGPKKRILFLRIDSIGDNILAASLLKYIHAESGEAMITVVCQNHIAELYEKCPYVNNIIAFDKARALSDEPYLNEIVTSIKELNADLLLNTVYSREPITDYLALNSGAKICAAFEGDLSNISAELRDRHNALYTRLIRSEGLLKPEMERNADFLTGIGGPSVVLEPVVWLGSEDEAFADEFFRANGLDTEKTVALFVCAQWTYKYYEHYREVLSAICKEMGLSVIALGSEQDSRINDSILDGLGIKTYNLAGKTSLRQTAAIIKRCRIGIGADTGAAHIACAVGTPNVTVLGGGHFARFLPYSKLTSVVCLPLECYGCNWKCRYSRVHCIKDISPDVMVEAIRRTLDHSSDRPRVFVQASSLWKQVDGMPAWRSFHNMLNLASVEVLPVGELPAFIAGLWMKLGVMDKDAQIGYLRETAAGYILQGEHLFAGNDLKAAEEAFLNALQILNNAAEALNDLGVLYSTRGDYDKAEKYYEAAVSSQPGNATYLKNLADIHYVIRKDIGKALPLYIKVHSVNPDDVETLMALGNVSIEIGQMGRAREFFGRVLELDPANRDAATIMDLITKQEPLLDPRQANNRTGAAAYAEQRHGESDIADKPGLEGKRGIPMKISVITPSYNQARYIEQTIRSVMDQGYPNYEHIVMDGGSADGTVEVLKKYPHLVWSSEKDRGQSDALNKGFRKATGDIIAWINSDDWYEPGIFNVIAQWFADNPEENIVMGDCNLIDESGKVFDKVVNRPRGFNELKQHWIARSIPTQPAIFFRKRLLDEFGYLDEGLHYAMDYDLWMRFAQKSYMHHLDLTVANYRFHSGAKGGDQDWSRFVPECAEVHKRYISACNGVPVVSVVITCFNYARYLRDAVESVTKQSFRDFEIIIVNDGSSDNSREVAEALISQYFDLNIRLLNQDNSGHPATARNNGIAISFGKFILPLDADDMIAPTMLEECVVLLENSPDVSIAYTDQIYFGEESPREVHTLEYDLGLLVNTNYIGCCSMFRKKAWEEAGGYKRIGYEDWEFWINCGEKGHKGKRIAKPLFLYRNHSSGNYAADLKNDQLLKARITLNHPKLYSPEALAAADALVNKAASAAVDASRLRIVAIIAAFNEGDVIYHVIKNLVEQDIEVYLIDHHSTDNTVSEASKWLGKGLIKVETFPDDSGFDIAKDVYAWRFMLMRKEQVARKLGAGWYIHADADEFRESPWPDLNLRQAIERVDSEGFNAINFKIFDFKPTDNSFVPGSDVRDYLHYYSAPVLDYDNVQVKCWKNFGQPFELWKSGGHVISFDGVRIYPIPFILRHYPIRSQAHGEQKVFNERKKRFDTAEKEALWHAQYDQIKDSSHNYIQDRADLTHYDRDAVCKALLQKYQRPETVAGLVSIVILTFNELKYTKECIESIQRHTPERHEIIFVDNASSDGTSKWLAQLVKDNANYKLITNTENLGFAKGCNQGIMAASGEYVLLLNNDVVVTENWLSGLLECLNSAPDIGIVGPMTNSISGPQRVSGAAYKTMKEMQVYAKEYRGQHRHRRIAYRRVVGFCMLFRHALAEKIGLLDESFGTGNFEDDDYCLRSILSGCRNLIAGDVFIHHYGSRSFIGNKFDYTRLMTGNIKIFDEKWTGLDLNTALGKRLAAYNSSIEADSLWQKGNLDAAIAALIKGIGIVPYEKSLYYQLAGMLLDAKLYKDALEAVNSMPNAEADDMRRLELIGYCTEDPDEADKYADLMLSIDNSSAEALNLKGIASFKKADRETASALFEKALLSDPGYGEPYTNLGVIRWSAEDKAEALKFLEKGFVLSPLQTDSVTLYHSAVTELQEFARAEQLFREAREFYPENQRILFLLIDILIKQQKFEMAMAEIELALLNIGVSDGILEAAIEIRKKIGDKAAGKTEKGRAALSLCMIVKNEEKHLARCLLSARSVVDEMIIVDTGSTDRTRDIAWAFGAEVFDFVWTDDFSEARNFSLSKASCDWILVLDADEVISPLDYAELEKIVRRKPAKPVAYTMVTRNYTHEVTSKGWTPNDRKYMKEEAGTGWFPSAKIRLFVNDPRLRFQNPVHEFVEGSAEKAGIENRPCSIPVHHYGRFDKAKILAKGREYFQLGMKKLEETGGDIKALKELAIQASELAEYETAVEVWNKVIALNDRDAIAYMNISYAYLKLERYHEALKASGRATELDPSMKEAALNYAGSEFIAGDLSKAVSVLERMLKSDPEYPPAMVLVASAYFRCGERERAMNIFEKLRRRGFDWREFMEEQARALMSLQKFDQAALVLEAAIATKNITNDTDRLLDECRAV